MRKVLSGRAGGNHSIGGKIMKAYNIQWDTETRAEFNLLPKEVVIPKGITDEEEISDYLSDTFGYCHKGFSLTTD